MLMSHPDPLVEQYNRWAYPQPINDLDDYKARGGFDLTDPTRIWHKLWPMRDPSAPLSILVAGCGTNQAAIIAHANPLHHVVGIDPSYTAIKNHEALRKRHGLANLELLQGEIDAGHDTGNLYDYIICTGVLHHVHAPDLTLNTLRRKLKKDGAMSLMVYGRHGRVGVYMVQEALRQLGAARSPEDCELARDVVERLPPWHAATHYRKMAPDLLYDAGWVDTFLNARDTAFTIPELMALINGAGLRFHDWLDGMHYSPSAVFPPDAAILDRLEALPKVRQWDVVDLLTQRIGAHRFLVTHAKPTNTWGTINIEAAWNDDAWLDLIPTIAKDVSLKPGSDGLIISRNWHKVHFKTNETPVIRAINGASTFRDILSDGHADLEFWKLMFFDLAEWEYVHLRHSNIPA